MSSILIIVHLLLLAALVQDGIPVRCWTCTSNMLSACNDPFRSKASSLIKLDNCDAKSGPTYLRSYTKSACKKQKRNVNSKPVIIRGCTWKRTEDQTSNCPRSSNVSSEETTFCETCDYDGCNGALAVSKSLTLLIVPLEILLFN